MNIVDSFKKVVFQNYANFKGRATRSEFWYFSLVNILLYFVWIFTGVILEESETTETFETISAIVAIVIGIYYVGTLIPSLAVTARRLHDTGKSGWYILIYLVPFVGSISLIIFLSMDSEKFTNRWGPNPKAPADEINDIGLTNQIWFKLIYTFKIEFSDLQGFVH